MQNPNPKPLDTHFHPQNDNILGELREEEEEEEEEDEDEEDEDEVEESVGEMAQRIQEYRKSCPHKLKTTLASLLDSQRPLLPPSIQPPPHPYTQGSSGGSASDASLMEEDPEDIKKLELLKQKISSNASAISVTLKRMRECMDKMDKLQSQKGVIHPAFKKKTLTD